MVGPGNDHPRGHLTHLEGAQGFQGASSTLTDQLMTLSETQPLSASERL